MSTTGSALWPLLHLCTCATTSRSRRLAHTRRWHPKFFDHVTSLMANPYLSPLLSVVRHFFGPKHSLKVHSQAISQQTHSIAPRLVTTGTVGLMARRITSKSTSKPVLPPSITLTCLALQVRIHMWNVATKDDKLVLPCHWVLNYQ
jgi:hypothetical protein